MYLHKRGKHLLGAIVIVAVTMGGISVFQCLRPSMKEISGTSGASKGIAKNRLLPLPTEMGQKKVGEDEGDEQYARMMYFERKHLAAPGVEWRAIDRKTRTALHQQRRTLVEKLTREKRYLPGGKNIEHIEFAAPSPEVSPNAQQQSSAAVAAAVASISGQWIERGSNNQAGRMHAGDVDAATGAIYLGEAGGLLWKGSLNGNDWAPVNDHYRFDNIKMVRAIQNGAGMRILVLDGHNLHYSDDDGTTWNVSSGYTNDGWWSNPPNKVVVVPGSSTIYCTASFSSTDVRLYKSTDAGTSFTQINNFNVGNMTLWTSRYGAGTVFLLKDTTLYALDAQDQLVMRGVIRIGQQMSLSALATDKGAYLAGCDNSIGPTLYALYPTNSQSFIYQSTDGGRTWVFRSSLTERPFMDNSFAVSTIDANQVFIGSACSLTFRSTDGALTWTQPPYGWGTYYSDPLNSLHCDIPGITMFRRNDGQEFSLIHTDGGTYISNDGLQNVTNISLHNLRTSQYYSTYSYRQNPEIIFAGSQDQGFQRSAAGQGNGVYNFDQLGSGDQGSFVSGDSGETVWFVYPGLLYCLRNATTSSFPDTYGYGDTIKNTLWLTPLMEDPDDARSVFLAGGHPNGGSGGYLYHFTCNAGVWSFHQETFQFNGAITAMAYSSVNKSLRYVATDAGSVYYSTNSGSSWTKSSFNNAGSFYLYGSTIVTSPLNANIVYLAGSGYSNPAVYVSKDHGATFSDFSTGLPSTLVQELALTPNESFLFAATEVGPYCADVNTGRWEYIGGTDAPDQTYVCVDYVPSIKTARFGTYGRGIWDFRLANTPPIIATPPSASPNPVIGTTTVLSVLGADDGGEANLVYTWSTTGNPPAAVSYSINGTNAAKNTTVTFSASGTYDLQVTIRDQENQTVAGSVSVSVNLSAQKLTGTTFGTSPAWNNGSSTYDKAFDGSTGTFFDYSQASGGYTGIDLGSGNAKKIGKIRFNPRASFASRMNGGKFQGSTTSTSSGYTDLYTIPSTPNSGWNEITVTDNTSWRYLRYLGPSNGYCNVAEIEFFPASTADNPPTILNPAAATANPVTGTTTSVSVLGSDDGGESNLTYNWSTTGTPPAPVTFSVNNSNAAKTSVAGFTKAGDYTILATVRDQGNQTVTSTVTITVVQTITSISVSPASPSVPVNSALAFSASAKDQFGASIALPPALTWSASGGGNVDNNGFYVTGCEPGGPYTITAKSGEASGVASATITGTNYPPSITSAAMAATNPVTSATTVLSASAADDGGIANLTYTWTTTGTPPASVTYSVNGTNSAKNTTVTFTKAGSYDFLVTIRDKCDLSATSQVTVTVTWNAPQVYRINCGSNTAASPFTADQYGSGGTMRMVTDAIDLAGAANPAPLAVYQSERYGNSSYTLTDLTASAQYTVRLHFAELYQTAIGRRLFNVVINGTTVLSNFDIYAATGARYKATVREFTATADNSGKIVINFTTITDNATIEGIEIIGK